MKDQRGPFPEIIERLERFIADQDEYVMLATHDSEQEIIDLVIHDQMWEQGIRATGTPIRPLYHEQTIELKIQKGQRWDHVTLRDSEDFHASVFVDFREKEFFIDALDWKKEILMRKYGKTILGLTNENLQFLIDKRFRPRAKDIFRKAIFG